MNCMKCGREIGNDQTFCPKCLEGMAAYPVKSDALIRLPARQEAPNKKVQPRKRVRTPEEQILRLKKKNRWLAAIVCLLLVISIVLAFLSIDVIRQLDVQKFLGQNYSTVETTR